jgi:hypothetical protein
METPITDMEWCLAKKKLGKEDMPRRGELIHLHKSPNPYKSNALGHSFLLFDSKPYAILNQAAGEGQFGVVKFSQSEGGSRYAVKMRLNTTLAKAQYGSDDEVEIAKDVGLFIHAGKERKAGAKLYCMMPDLGEDLVDFLHKKITIAERLDIAIKLAAEVSLHHQGYKTLSGRKLIHRDI